jgi:lysophospholipase L1-like esterase
MVEEPVIIAKTGWTTDELMTGIEETNPHGLFDLVSLLIGVNNQYREKDVREYRKEFKALLDKAIPFAAGDPSHVVVLSIPDWGVTPFADGRDRTQIAAEIDRFNAVNREESELACVHYLDIAGISRNAATDPTLIANDGLHPSSRMYSEWAKMVVAEMFPEKGH